MCLLESDSHLPDTMEYHLIPLNGAKVIFHFVLEPQLSCLRLHAGVAAFQYSLLLNLRAFVRSF